MRKCWNLQKLGRGKGKFQSVASQGVGDMPAYSGSPQKKKCETESEQQSGHWRGIFKRW